MASNVLIASILLLAYFAAPSQAFYFFTSSIHEAYQSILPAEVTLLYSALNGQEMSQMKSAGSHLDQGAGDEPCLQVLKSMNEPLFTRVVQSRDSIAQKINSLNAEAKAFVNDVIAKARSLRPASGQQPDSVQTRVQAANIIEQFNALSDDAKRSLAAIFPEIVAGIEGAEFQELAAKDGHGSEEL